MKAFAAVVFLALASVAASSTAPHTFREWVAKHGKVYGTLSEHGKRERIFEENAARVAKMMMADKDVGVFELNEFADQSPEELRAKYLRPVSHWEREQLLRTNNVIHPRPNLKDLPKAFNWVDEGAVTAVKNQASCGSCWAFGAVGNMEGQWFLNGPKQGKNALVRLSEQNLVDCDHECQVFPSGDTECDQGCNGGMEPNAFQYVLKAGGIMANADYTYKGRAGTCQFDKTKVAAKFSNWTYVMCNEEELMGYLKEHGPLSVGVHADEWFYYSSGVFDSACQLPNDHAVLLVGWGETDKGVKYWIIKNSWGTGWGQGGYIWLRRGVNKCGIMEMISTIIV